MKYKEKRREKYYNAKNVKVLTHNRKEALQYKTRVCFTAYWTASPIPKNLRFPDFKSPFNATQLKSQKVKVHDDDVCYTLN